MGLQKAPGKVTKANPEVTEGKVAKTEKASPEASKGSKEESPKEEAHVDHKDETITVTHRGMTVTRPLEDSNGNKVKSVDSYKNEITHHLDARANLRDDLKVVLPKGAEGDKHVDALLNALNDRHMTETKADIRLDRFHLVVPKGKQETVQKIVQRHKDNVLSTYDTK
jgi:hypothetical protein